MRILKPRLILQRCLMEKNARKARLNLAEIAWVLTHYDLPHFDLYHDLG